MALIRCPECGREISDKAPSCPGCGYPIAQIQAMNDPPVKLRPPVTVAEVMPSPLKLMNPLDGSSVEANLTPWQIQELNAGCQSDDDCNSWIDNLDLGGATRGSQILKKILKGLVGFTVQAGKLVFKMGKVILTNVIKIVRAFKHTIAGAVAGFILGCIFSSIPLIGTLLGPLVTPLLVAIGGIGGFMADMQEKIHDGELEARIRKRALQDFSDMLNR